MTTLELNEKQVVWKWEPTEEDAESIHCVLWYKEYVLAVETTFPHGTGLALYVRNKDEWHHGDRVDSEAVIWKLMQERQQMQELILQTHTEVLKLGERADQHFALLTACNAISSAAQKQVKEVVLTQEEAERIAFAIEHGTGYAWELKKDQYALAMMNAAGDLQTAIERAKR